MKFGLSLKAFVIVTGILISVTSLPITAATRCVNPGGTGGCSSSIQRAINAAAPGDTILIAKGIYTENLVVPKPLTMLGVVNRGEHWGWREDGERDGCREPDQQSRGETQEPAGDRLGHAGKLYARRLTRRTRCPARAGALSNS